MVIDKKDTTATTPTFKHIYITSRSSSYSFLPSNRQNQLNLFLLYRQKIWENLQFIVQETKSNPGVINLTQENIIYMKGIPLLTHLENEQLSEIIQEVKQQTSSSRRNERQTYEAISRNAHLRKSMIQIKKFREANSRDISFCKKLIEANDRRA